jgi:hypothetical protein
MKKPNLAILVASSALALTVLAPSSAQAAPEFPKYIKDHLALDYEPPCELCHWEGNAGIGTIRTPFGLSVRSYGPGPDGSQEILAAIDQMATAKIDSDGDGTDDVTELKSHRDPNVAAPGDTPYPNPNIVNAGCSVGGADHSDRTRDLAAPLAGLVVAGVVIAGARRRAKKGTRQ